MMLIVLKYGIRSTKFPFFQITISTYFPLLAFPYTHCTVFLHFKQCVLMHVFSFPTISLSFLYADYALLQSKPKVYALFPHNSLPYPHRFSPILSFSQPFLVNSPPPEYFFKIYILHRNSPKISFKIPLLFNLFHNFDSNPYPETSTTFLPPLTKTLVFFFTLLVFHLLYIHIPNGITTSPWFCHQSIESILHPP